MSSQKCFPFFHVLPIVFGLLILQACAVSETGTETQFTAQSEDDASVENLTPPHCHLKTPYINEALVSDFASMNIRQAVSRWSEIGKELFQPENEQDLEFLETVQNDKGEIITELDEYWQSLHSGIQATLSANDGDKLMMRLQHFVFQIVKVDTQTRIPLRDLFRASTATGELLFEERDLRCLYDLFPYVIRANIEIAEKHHATTQRLEKTRLKDSEKQTLRAQLASYKPNLFFTDQPDNPALLKPTIAAELTATLVEHIYSRNIHAAHNGGSGFLQNTLRELTELLHTTLAPNTALLQALYDSVPVIDDFAGIDLDQYPLITLFGDFDVAIYNLSRAFRLYPEYSPFLDFRQLVTPSASTRSPENLSEATPSQRQLAGLFAGHLVPRPNNRVKPAESWTATDKDRIMLIQANIDAQQLIAQAWRELEELLEENEQISPRIKRRVLSNSFRAMYEQTARQAESLR